MRIWAIGDLHLSFDKTGKITKPMVKFGANWQNHGEKIFSHWQEKVQEEDWVLLAGDISWAMKPQEAIYDLLWLKNLPGQKVLVKGNHDYWRQGTGKTKTLLEPMLPLYNNALEIGSFVLCGGRGYQETSDNADEKLKMREYARVKTSLEAGYALNKEIIVLLHYPPYDADGKDNIFSELLAKYEPKAIIYGHLHNKKNIYRKTLGKIKMYPVSADYLDFNLQLIL